MKEKHINWKDKEWLDSVYQWIHSELNKNNLELNGELDQFHIKPWSTVMKVQTKTEMLYFKACAPVLKHEVHLTGFLSEQNIKGTPNILSIDKERGWLLIHDAGKPMRSFIQDKQKPDHWLMVLPLLAETQIQLTNSTDQLLELGVFDRRLSKIPSLFESLLEDKEILLLDQKDGLTIDQYNKLKDYVPHFKKMCQELSDFNIPESLHHDDFHDNNIFIKEGKYTIADWGESCITHPFFSVIIALRIAAYILKLKDDDPIIDQMKESYLSSWIKYGSMKTLYKAFELASMVGMVNRALTWYAVVKDLTGNDKEENKDAVPGWLLNFYEAAGIDR